MRTGTSHTGRIDSPRVRVGWAALLALAVTGAHTARAETPLQLGDPGASARIDVPAQDLDAALRRLGMLSGVQLLYDPTLTAGLQVQAVDDAPDARAALEALLDGTGLAAAWAGPAEATLVRREVAVEQASRAVQTPILEVEDTPYDLEALMREFLELLGRETKRRVEWGRVLDRSNFLGVVSLDIDASGYVSIARVQEGDTDRGGAIERALSGWQVSRPPPVPLTGPVLIELEAVTRQRR